MLHYNIVLTHQVCSIKHFIQLFVFVRMIPLLRDNINNDVLYEKLKLCS